MTAPEPAAGKGCWTCKGTGRVPDAHPTSMAAGLTHDCPACHGTGAEPASQTAPDDEATRLFLACYDHYIRAEGEAACTTCYGDGVVGSPASVLMGEVVDDTREECSDCHGVGMIGGRADREHKAAEPIREALWNAAQRRRQLADKIAEDLSDAALPPDTRRRFRKLIEAVDDVVEQRQGTKPIYLGTLEKAWLRITPADRAVLGMDEGGV